MRFVACLLALLLGGALLASHPTSSGGIAAAQTSAGSGGIARGRYLVAYGGCNDCHTPGYSESGGRIPESRWLTGAPVGFRGPWGTTYPTNLRLLIANMSESHWLALAHAGKMRPPMPFWALQTLHDGDLRAMYVFIKSLGPAGKQAPAYVPPGKRPATPWIYFVPVTH